MRYTMLVTAALCMTLTPPAILAAGTIHVSSDRPADVELNGQPIGQAPLTIRDLDKGVYDIRVKALDSGKVEVARVFVPAGVSVEREVIARFAPARTARATARRDRRPTARYRRADDDDDDDGGKNWYVRRRNIGLGATALGAITGSGLLTGLGIGGVVVNELSEDDKRERRGRR